MKFKLYLWIFLLCPIISLGQNQPVTNARDSNAVKELFFAGLKEKMVEDYAKANNSFSKIITLDPNNHAAYFELATLNFRQQKLLDAETAIKKAINLNPTNVWYYKLQAEIYKINGNMEALVEALDEMIKLTPDDKNLYFDKANAFYIAGKTQQSKEIYNSIESKFGSSKELEFVKKRFDISSGASTQESKLIAKNTDDASVYIFLSGRALKENKQQEALTYLHKAKKLEPYNFKVDLAMADFYRLQKKDDSTMISLKSAFANLEMPLADKMQIVTKMLPKFNELNVAQSTVELVQIITKSNPEEPKIMILYGDILYQQGNLQGAKEQYEAVLKISDQNYIAWEKLLGIQTLIGKYAEAIKTSEEALTIYPNQAILYYYRAFALHRNAQNAEAALEIKTALQLDPDDNNLKAMIFALQAEVLIDQQKIKEADAAFDKAVNLAPNNYLTISNYAYYLALRNHDLNKAEALAAKAAQAMPKNASILDTYALVLFKQAKYNEALDYIKRALQNNEASNPVYLEHYGDILFLKGDKELALLQWQKAKQAGNDSDKLIKKINEKKYIK